MKNIEENYVGKWVVVYRYPNAQNNFIGKIQCLFVRKQTENQIYGTEHDRPAFGHMFHYHKKEITMKIHKEEEPSFLIKQRRVNKEFKDRKEQLRIEFSRIMKSISKGEL